MKFSNPKNKEDILSPDHLKLLCEDAIELSMPTVSVQQAVKDFKRERVLLNGVPFIPDIENDFRSESFVSSLRLLAERLVVLSDSIYSSKKLSYRASNSDTKSDTHKRTARDAGFITDLILQRASRTGTGSDSFFVVQSYLCSPDTFVTQRSDGSDPPIKLDFFICPDSGQLLCRVEVKNMFSVFDISAMDEDMDSHTGPVPFLNVETVVIDESNFDSSYHQRYLKIDVALPTPGMMRSPISPK